MPKPENLKIKGKQPALPGATRHEVLAALIYTSFVTRGLIAGDPERVAAYLEDLADYALAQGVLTKEEYDTVIPF